MSVAQGINKTVAYKKQTGIGVAAAGAGGTLLRRETATFNLMKDTYDANEIVSHQQDTGIGYGTSKTQGALNGLISAGSYAPLLGSLCRKDFVATTAITAASFTIAGAGPYTITRAAGSFLTDGVKVGDVVRITAGTYTGIASNLNMLVTGVVALVLTVVVPNGKVLAAQGPVTGSTLTIIGKKSSVPSTGQTNDYYTFEEWSSDITRSRTYVDTQVASAAISIPPNGNSTVQLSLLGLSRAKGTAQVLTSPAAAPTTAILAGANGYIMLNGAQTIVGTSLSLKIDGKLQHGEAVIGSRSIADIAKGDIRVSGSVSILHQGETTSDLFVNETAVALIAVLFADTSDTSDFVGFTLPAIKLTKDDIDDGKKQIVMTCDFIAQYNAAGGAAVATDTGIITIQDAQA